MCCLSENFFQRLFDEESTTLQVLRGKSKRISQKDEVKLFMVNYEEGEDIYSAISREKKIKGKLRKKKILLIEKLNPEWRDLYLDLINEKPMSL